MCNEMLRRGGGICTAFNGWDDVDMSVIGVKKCALQFCIRLEYNHDFETLISRRIAILIRKGIFQTNTYLTPNSKSMQ